jgi:hypothetical protein
LAEILPSRPHALPGAVSPQYRNAYIEAFEQIIATMRQASLGEQKRASRRPGPSNASVK